MSWELVEKEVFGIRGRHKRNTPAIRKSVSVNKGKKTTTMVCLMPKELIGNDVKTVIIYEDAQNRRIGFKALPVKDTSGYAIRQIKSNSDMVEFNIPKKFEGVFKKGTTDVTVMRESKTGYLVLEY